MAKEQTPTLTTNAGVTVEDNQNSITAGPRGPVLLQDYWLLEKLATFNRERIRSESFTRKVRPHTEL